MSELERPLSFVFMLLGAHLIFSAYGFWLPNDPRGSWSDFVASWELLRFGKATKVSTTRSVAWAPHDVALRKTATKSLFHPSVTHAHLVIGAPREPHYLIARRLKACTTRFLREKGIDPMQGHVDGASAPQHGLYRKAFFRDLIVSKRLPGLTFNWFVTWSDRQKTLPALAEAEILQAYFDQYGHLPKLNKCI